MDASSLPNLHHISPKRKPVAVLYSICRRCTDEGADVCLFIKFLSPKDYVKTNVRLAQISDQHELARMRELLWPESSREEHRQEVAEVLRTGKYGTLPMTILVSHEEGGALTGFLEVGLRSHADGCDTAQPVGFVEGWFVHEAFRRQGTGKALMRSAEEWARNQGCHEMASDTWIDDERSILTHRALGFEVVDRCVHFRKTI